MYTQSRKIGKPNYPKFIGSIKAILGPYGIAKILITYELKLQFWGSCFFPRVCVRFYVVQAF